MTTFTMLLINIVLLLFPIIIIMFYFAYTKNADSKQNEFFLDFALLSSLYLLVTNNSYKGYDDFMLLLNIPLIIAYMKQRELSSLIMSATIILMYYMAGIQDGMALFIQYVLYYIAYTLTIDRKKSCHLFLLYFIIIKFLFLMYHYIFYSAHSVIKLIDIFLAITIFAIITYLILCLFKKGEDIIKLHMSIKELENDKQIRTSLFKITHEIKNPIAVCKSYLDMYDSNNKEHEKYIPIVKEEIERILLLLQDFLSMNRIKINKDILDINMLLEDIVSQFEPVLKDKEIDFKTNVSLDEVFVDGDYNRLSQVLINMIKNSIEAIDCNKKPYISINQKIENNNYIITIEDNGVGINSDEIEKIKEPFYTTKKNGTGLGVSLSYEIVKAHGGDIIYQSKFGEGTKVIINLPIINYFD